MRESGTPFGWLLGSDKSFGLSLGLGKPVETAVNEYRSYANHASRRYLRHDFPRFPRLEKSNISGVDSGCIVHFPSDSN